MERENIEEMYKCINTNSHKEGCIHNCDNCGYNKIVGLKFKIDYDSLINYPVNPKNYISLNVKRGYKKKGVKSMFYVYSCLGIDFNELKDKFNDGEKLSVEQIYINPKSFEKISEIIKKSYRDDYKGRGKGVYPSYVYFDLMNWSPIQSDDIIEDCIIIKEIDDEL